MKEQLQLFVRGSAVGEVVETILARGEVKDKAGEVVGHVVKLGKRKEIAQELGLTHKSQRDELDVEILSRRDMMMREVKATVAGLDAQWTFTKVATRDLASGIRQLTVVAQRVPRKKGPSDEEIAKAFGWTVERVRAERAANEAKAAREAVDIESTRIPQAALPLEASVPPVVQPDGSAPALSDEADKARQARIDEVRGVLTKKDLAEYRSHYAKAYGKASTLTDEQLVVMVADSEDDNSAQGWAECMKAIEGV